MARRLSRCASISSYVKPLIAEVIEQKEGMPLDFHPFLP
jgi:hypothetical protein